MTTPLDRLPAAILDRFLAGETLPILAADYYLTGAEVEDYLRIAIRERLEEEDE